MVSTAEAAKSNGKASGSRAGDSAAEKKAKDRAMAVSEVESKQRAESLKRTVGQIEKTFGKGSIMRLDEKAFAQIPGHSTGTISLDLALGGRGIPMGRIVEIYGPESSGKTTLALTVAGNVQKRGGVHRRRACAGPDMGAQAGGERR